MNCELPAADDESVLGANGNTEPVSVGFVSHLQYCPKIDLKEVGHRL